MLRLQADALVATIRRPALAADAGHAVGRVQLHARFGRLAGELPAGVGIEDERGGRHLPDRPLVGPADDVVQVVAGRVVAGIEQSLADRRRLAEVERRALHRREFAGRDEVLVDRRVLSGEDLQFVVADVLAVVAVQIEVGVVRQIDRCRGVGLGFVLDRHRVLVGREHVPHGDDKLARVALLAVGRDGAKDDHAVVGVLRIGLRGFGLADLSGPDLLREGVVPAAVQVVLAAVRDQCVVGSVQAELPAGDAVGVPTDGAAEVGVLAGLVAGDLVEPEHDIGPVAVAVRHGERLDGRAVVN